MFRMSERKDDINPIRRGMENREIPSIYTPGMNRLMMYRRIPSIRNVPNPSVTTMNLSEK